MKQIQEIPSMKWVVKKAAVLGAGVMGAQIAAHLANARVPVVLFDLPAKEGDKNGVVKKALDGLKRLQPSPLVSRDTLQYIDAANYEEHLELLSGCDLIIEAIAERMDWKNDLYARIAPFAGHRAGVQHLGPVDQRAGRGAAGGAAAQFCGIHFFNPPRYMPLVEIIATRDSAPAMLDGLETWLTSRLGKGVVRALDTPNFVANRIGVFSILAVMHHTAAFGLGFDTVDALTGPKIGRPERHLPHRRRGRPGHPGPRREHHARHPAERPVARLLQGAGVARRPDRPRRAGPEDQGRHLPQAGQGDRGVRPGRATTGPATTPSPPKSPPSSSSPTRPPASRLCANRATQAQFCGRSSATSSTTARCNWRTWPTTPATWILRCAGASAGRRGPSSCGRRRAGPTRRRRSPPTSRPAGR
jgi:hypothetical protein